MKYNVAIIGGGPAGLMAAGRAGELADKVVLIEKNKQPGIKLLATGGGRCNFTNNLVDPKQLAARLGKNGKFLISALHKFGVKETLDFFVDGGVKIKIEKDNKVFPASNQAGDVLAALLENLKRNKVEILIGQEVRKIITSGRQITKIILANGQEIEANNYIIATGGKSYPQTGSTGDGYDWLKQLGHTIITPRPALAPFIVKESFIKQLEGLSLEQVKISLLEKNKKIGQEIGDIIFTGSGVSGPAVHNLSRLISQAENKELTLDIDFFPELDHHQLEKKLQQIFNQNSNKEFKNSLTGFIRPKLIPVLGALARLKPGVKANAITREQRKSIVQLLKNFKLAIKALGGFDKAMITSGGVALNEVEPRTMRSKIISNLFICGEVLDLDGPTGGFNLQICWTTGYVAGENAVAS